MIFTAVFAAFFLAFNVLLMTARNSYLKLPKGINKVFLGNSTVEYGVNDCLIPGSINFAQNAEPIDIMYAKLRLIQRFNPNVDTVFVELDDIVLFNNDIQSIISNAIYFDAFDVDDWLNNMRYHTFDRFTKYFSHSYDIIKLRPIFEHIYKSHDITNLGVGGYQRLYRDKLYEDIKRMEQSSLKNRTVNDISESNRYYYRRIVEFCEEKNITVIFFNVPKHEKLWGDSVYREFWRDDLNDVKFIDCTRIQLSDSCYGDMSHLNYRGAEIFSNKFDEILSNK